MKTTYPLIIALHGLALADHDFLPVVTFHAVPVLASHQYLKQQGQHYYLWIAMVEPDESSITLCCILCFLFSFFYFTVRQSCWQIMSSFPWLPLYSSGPQTQHIMTALLSRIRMHTYTPLIHRQNCTTSCSPLSQSLRSTGYICSRRWKVSSNSKCVHMKGGFLPSSCVK